MNLEFVMVGCTSLLRRRNVDKVEGMAAWLILGGVVPLEVAVGVRQQLGIHFDAVFYLYLWVTAMGIASLCVKRASASWRMIVVSGATGFLTIAAARINDFGAADAGAIIWSFTVLGLICFQYRSDMKIRQRVE